MYEPVPVTISWLLLITPTLSVPPSYTQIALAYHAVHPPLLFVHVALNQNTPCGIEKKLTAAPDKLSVTETV